MVGDSPISRDSFHSFGKRHIIQLIGNKEKQYTKLSIILWGSGSTN